MKDSSIATFDPINLRSKLFGGGGFQFHSYMASAHEAFHINRIEDYNRIVTLPSQWDAQPFRLTVFSFFFLTKGASVRSKGLITYDIGPDTFFFLPPYEISTYNLKNEGAEGFFCLFNPDLLTSDYTLKDLLSNFPFLNFNCHPLVLVTPEMKEEVVIPILERLGWSIFQQHTTATQPAFPLPMVIQKSIDGEKPTPGNLSGLSIFREYQ